MLASSGVCFVLLIIYCHSVRSCSSEEDIPTEQHKHTQGALWHEIGGVACKHGSQLLPWQLEQKQITFTDCKELRYTRPLELLLTN